VAANWPSNLPQQVYTEDGPTYQGQSNVIRTDMTTGPAKVRRRFTAISADVTAQLELSKSELAILQDFVQNTLGEVDPFNWTNPYNGTPASFRFKEGWSSVKLKRFANDLWTVSMELEMLP
jgi:hypothetical protein